MDLKNIPISSFIPKEIPLNASDMQRYSSTIKAPAPEECELMVSDMRNLSSETVPMPKDAMLDATDSRMTSTQTVPIPADAKLDVTDGQMLSNEIVAMSNDSSEVSDDEATVQAATGNLSDMETIKRLKVKKKEFKDNFNHAVALDAMKRHIIRADERYCCLLIYDEAAGYFKRWEREHFLFWLREAFHGSHHDEHLNRRVADDVFDRILSTPEIKASFDDFAPEQPFLNVLNGVVDVRSGKLLEHSPQFLFTSVIHAKYLEHHAQPPRKFNAMLDGWFADNLNGRQQLLECLAYLFSEYHTAKIAFYCVGEPNTGKSVLLKFIEHMIGVEMVANVPLEAFSEKHTLPLLQGVKVVCYGERDEGGKPLTKSGAFKAYVGGDGILANPKHRKQFKFKPKGKCIFMSNRPLEIDPRISEEALSQRFLFIEFCNPVKRSRRIPDFDRVLFSEERDEILTMLVPILRKWLKKDRKFTKSDGSKRLMEDFLEQRCSSDEFVAFCCNLRADAITPIWALKKAYLEFCADNALTSMAPGTFIRVIKDTYHLTKHKPHRLWSLVGIELREHDEEKTV